MSEHPFHGDYDGKPIHGHFLLPDTPTGIAAFENESSFWANAVTRVTGPFMVTTLYGTWVYRYNGDVAMITGSGACRWVLPAGAVLQNTVPPADPQPLERHVGLVGGFYLVKPE